jgi:hypothetical protein
MSRGSGYGNELRERAERFLFVGGERDVARQAEHFEELNCLVINVRED